jgi:hypothetical protein
MLTTQLHCLLYMGGTAIGEQCHRLTIDCRTLVRDRFERLGNAVEKRARCNIVRRLCVVEQQRSGRCQCNIDVLRIRHAHVGRQRAAVRAAKRHHRRIGERVVTRLEMRDQSNIVEQRLLDA